MRVRLFEVTSDNWRSVADVAPLPEQQAFVAPVARYLALCHYGGEWSPLAITAGGAVVGHVMWARDDDDGSIWLGGLVVDGRHQRQGVGRAAVEAFIDRFDGSHIALSYDPDNHAARRLYEAIGFEETGEIEGDEVVARYQP